VDTTRGEIAGFARRSVDTSGEIAAFAAPSLGRPRPRTATPAARRYPVTVARSTCTATTMRLTGHPRCPSARTCCCLVCPKTWLIRAKDTSSVALVNVSAVVS
jgi:hypothetical protein